jgi:hypothetical protein
MKIVIAIAATLVFVHFAPRVRIWRRHFPIVAQHCRAVTPYGPVVCR